MSFNQEYVSHEDINKFQLDQLLNSYLNNSASYEHRWVVDKHTNSWLLPIKKLKSSESLWIFHYQNTNIEIKLFETDKGDYDLISIAPNSFNNVEIISTLHEALKVLGSNGVIYSKQKKRDTKEDKKEVQTNRKQKVKRKITYLDILTAGIILGILFFIANEGNYNLNSIIKNDNNSSKETLTTKAKYNIYSVIRTTNNDNAIFGINQDTLNTRTRILNFSSSVGDCKVDIDGNIYWSDATEQAIYKADPDGTNIRKIITVSGRPSGIAIDNKGKKIFWAQWLSDKKYGEIAYADLSGNDKNILLSNKNLMRSGRGMFYDYIYDKLYVGDQSGSKIIVIDIKTKEVTRLTYARQPSQLVLDYKNNKIIWTDGSSDNISSCNLDGSGKKVLIQFDDKFSNPDALTIDTINDRLMYEYYDRTSSASSVLETSQLDGTQRKIIQKVPHNDMHTLFFTNNGAKQISSQRVEITQNQPVTAPKLKKCFACHGKYFEKRALGKSMIVKNMSKENIYRALIGYKNGTYGGPLKGIMKGQIAQYSNQELEAMAEAIKSQ